MSYGPIAVFSATIASGASTSDSIKLSRGWKNISVQVGTMSTAMAVAVQNSADGGSTYYNVFKEPVNSATVASYQLFIPSACGTNGSVLPVPLDGLNQIRFVGTAVVSGGCGFKVICSD